LTRPISLAVPLTNMRMYPTSPSDSEASQKFLPNVSSNTSDFRYAINDVSETPLAFGEISITPLEVTDLGTSISLITNALVTDPSDLNNTNKKVPQKESVKQYEEATFELLPVETSHLLFLSFPDAAHFPSVLSRDEELAHGRRACS
jgi:hypothetical protein